MKFENTPQDNSSFERPKPGKYLGVLVGFAYVGTQPGGKFDPQKKVMLRWELHKRKGPSVDSESRIHTVTQTYSATVRSDKSNLKKCLEAHGIDIPVSGETESQDWLGKAAWLDVEEAENDERYVNVAGVSKLDPDDDVAPRPMTPLENWEPAAGGKKCPMWASWAVARSLDIRDFAQPKKVDDGSGKRQLAGAGVATSNGSGAPKHVDVVDDDDIPF